MSRKRCRHARGAFLGAVGVLALALPGTASAQVPTISIDDPTVTEGNVGTSNASFTVSLSEPSSETVTVDFGTSNGTATAALDYVSRSETVTFNPGDTSKQVTVQVNGDSIDEPDETFNGNLSNASVNASIGDSQGVATITDDDGAPGISVNDVAHPEGDAGQKDFNFTVSLSNPSSSAVTVDFATADATATVADGDYDARSVTVPFAPLETQKTVTVKANGDGTDESDETFGVDLTNNSANSSIADGHGVGTIQNDDADPAISIGNVSAAEGNSGQKDFDFTVSLNHASAQTVTAQYATSNGTATQPSDYASASGTVTFTPGDTSESVTVKVNGDTTNEPDEGFNVNLTNNSPNSSIADGQGLGTIQNDDGEPSISIGNVSAAEGNTGQQDFDFTVSLSNPSATPVTVDFATADGTATVADNDYDANSGTVMFAAGDISESVTVKVNGDSADEPHETFDVELTSNSPNSSVADGQGVGTIQNDDAAQTIAACPAAATDEEEGRVFGSGDIRVAQTFTAQTSGVAVSAHAKVLKQPGTSGDWVLSLNSIDTSGTPTNAAVRSVTVPDSTVPDGVGTIGGTFEPLAIVAGEQYALAVTRPGASDVSVRIRVGNACEGESFASTTQDGTFAPLTSFGLPSGLDVVFGICTSAAQCITRAASSTAPEGPPPELQLTVGRALTLDANKKKVQKGKKVLLSGLLEVTPEEPACESAQPIDLQRKRREEPDFTTFGQIQTDAQGAFSAKVKVKKTSDYRAGVAETGVCTGGLSDTERVKVKK
jgi:hypothetical protein